MLVSLTAVLGRRLLRLLEAPEAGRMDPHRDEPGNEERHPGDPRDVPEPRDDPDEGRRLSDRLRDSDPGEPTEVSG